MSRKGQEEIVGFVLIVVLVVIVGVLFLGIRLRNPETTHRNSESIYQFLESSMEQTTDCKLSRTGNFLTLDTVIRECHNADTLCISEETSCTVARTSLERMLNASWRVGPAYIYKGYRISGTYHLNASDTSSSEAVFNVTEGECAGTIEGSSYWIPEFPGNIIVQLELCS